jgi:hypothetical protein
MRSVCAALSLVLSVASVFAQTPQPFPRPGAPAAPQQPAQQPPPSSPPRTAQPPVVTTPSPPREVLDPNAPSAAALGFPIYPAAQFLASFDAGRGQRYYLFGATASFADVVAFYRMQLDERGDVVFKEPPTHMFEVGRFRETMAFPPGVTVKDWMWGGSQGYPNPKLGAQPARFPTVVMIVPAPAEAAADRR